MTKEEKDAEKARRVEEAAAVVRDLPRPLDDSTLTDEHLIDAFMDDSAPDILKAILAGNDLSTDEKLLLSSHMFRLERKRREQLEYKAIPDLLFTLITKGTQGATAVLDEYGLFFEVDKHFMIDLGNNFCAPPPSSEGTD
jgi:hypothetical protein